MQNIKNKIYQMFILGFKGDNLKSAPNLLNALEKNLGGVIFFTQNIKSFEQTKKLIEDIKKQAKIPLFLSVDEEGGRVERTENLFQGKKFLSAKFAAQKGEDFLREQMEQISRLLKYLGLNLNFAPVLDVNTNPANPIIGERAFSDNTEEVIKFGKIVVDMYLKNRIIPCLKHFPGHGDASIDSHIALPQIDLDLKEMEKYHIKPFKEVDCPMIMVAHLYCKAFDAEKIPSSLSKNVVGYLKNTLNYKGLIITDDMVMGGITQNIYNQDSACMAIKAGVDILLYRNSDDNTIKIIEKLAEKAESDEVLYERIEESYNKIIQFKNSFFV